MEQDFGPVRLRGMRAIAIAFAVLIAGCIGDPSRAADITGQVTRSSAGASGAVVILVEEKPGEQTGNKVSVTVDKGARVLRETDHGTVEGTVDDVRGALVVSVWIDGPMLMSYPPQGKASFVVIRSPR